MTARTSPTCQQYVAGPEATGGPCGAPATHRARTADETYALCAAHAAHWQRLQAPGVTVTAIRRRTKA